MQVSAGQTRVAVLVAVWLGGGLGVLGATGTTARADTREDLHALFREYWEARLAHEPVRATYLGDHRWDDRLDDYSPQAREQWLAAVRGFLERARRFDEASLPPEDALNLRLFVQILTEEIDLSQFPGHLMPVRQQDGPHIDLPMLLLSHPFRTARDYENFIKRLRAFPEQVEQVIGLMREGVRRGIVAPRVIMEKVIPQLEAQIVSGPRESEFARPLRNFPEAIGPEARARLSRELRAAIMEAVVPAYERLLEFVRNEYLPKCRETVGLCHLPNGRAWYRRLARHHTTTDLTPEQIHEIGLTELRRIHAGMREIMKEVGFQGTLEEFIRDLQSRPDMRASSAEDLMSGFAAILRASDPRLPELFGRLPRARYELREIEAFRAPAAPVAYYYPPPEDMSRPGYFYVNTYEPRKRLKYTMEALAYHEARPGHHLQIALAMENRSLPDFRRHAGFTIFVEGWALYAESLGAELGGYRSPYSRFGRLTYDAWRAARLVVDTGMHHFGWTREQAVEFMKRNTALAELNIISEVDRYIAWPGQALAYKIGELAIHDLRRLAEERLGEAFDVRAFHDALLAEGALPLDVLRARMARWIDEQAAAAGPAKAAP